MPHNILICLLYWKRNIGHHRTTSFFNLKHWLYVLIKAVDKFSCYTLLMPSRLTRPWLGDYFFFQESLRCCQMKRCSRGCIMGIVGSNLFGGWPILQVRISGPLLRIFQPFCNLSRNAKQNICNIPRRYISNYFIKYFPVLIRGCLYSSHPTQIHHLC